MPENSRTGSADYLFQRIAAGKPPPLSLDGEKRSAARKWYRETASEIASVNAVKFFGKADSERMTNFLSFNEVGKMFMFWYDAKLKKELPYWDRFPLIFMIESYPDGFLGLNLHYLPPTFRSRLMDALYRNQSKDKIDAKTRLLIDYQILKSAAKYRYFKPCVKRYLFSHVASKFMTIRADEWDMALMLPTERFQKQRKAVVWQESVEKIGEDI